MLKKRVIPCLLLSGNGLCKTVKFDNPKYVGDPINAVRIFNEKEVDEIVLLDILKTAESVEPDYNLIEDIAGECFMPLSYGGGISSLQQIERLTYAGVEKVIINSAAINNPSFIRHAAEQFGSSTIIVSMDTKKNFFGKHEIFTDRGKRNTKKSTIEWAKEIEGLGAGEILLNSIEKDGAMTGYDIDIVKAIASTVNIPVVACGGAGSLLHVKTLFEQTEVSGAAAGSLFVYHGKHRAVLINYPTRAELDAIV